MAELGVLALQGATFIELLNHTARLTAEGLGAEFCKVLEYQPRDNRLLADWSSAFVAASFRRRADCVTPSITRTVCMRFTLHDCAPEVFTAFTHDDASGIRLDECRNEDRVHTKQHKYEHDGHQERS